MSSREAKLSLRRPQAENSQEVPDHAYLECLLNYSNVPIIAWDPAFKITLFNPAFEHLTGMTATEALGAPLDILFPKDTRKAALTRIHQALTGERWVSAEIDILCKNGDVRTVLWNSTPVYATDGKTLVSTIAQGQDITQRKRAEEAIKAANDRLMIEQEALNITLREVLNQIDSEKRQIGRQIQANVNRILMPILSKLEEKTAPTLKSYVSLLQSSLAEIASPFINKLETRYSMLLPREIRSM